MRSLADEPWLIRPETRAVVAALEAEGGAGCVRFVGGCVRNALLGQPVDDLDLATPLLPERSMQALKAAGLKVVPTGLAHGTVTAVSGGAPYEITTLRRDVETDGRRAVVAFTDDWAEDAARRDFRLNALYADAQGAIFDPTGQGLADLEARRVVFVGEAETRIREDYLRILRFFRFHAWYGRGAPDAEGLRASTTLAAGVRTLSAERVSKELLKLLAAPDPRPAVRAMAEAGVLAEVLPEVGALDLLEAMVERSADPVLRLSALLPPDDTAVAAAAGRLRLSNGQRDRLVAAVGEVPAGLTDREARALLYGIGRDAFRDRLTRTAASGAIGAEAVGRLERLAEGWTRPKMPVGGREVAKAGLAPGPDTGRVLAAFEAGWIADDFPTEGHAERLAAAIRSLSAPS